MGSEDIVSQNTSDAPLTTRVQDTLNLGSWHKSLKYIRVYYKNMRVYGSLNIEHVENINACIYYIYIQIKHITDKINYL